jgi:serine/threonine protein kinase
MVNERWDETVVIFGETQDLDPDARAARLESVDPELRTEVEQLLKHADLAEAEGFMEEPPWMLDDLPLFLDDFGGEGPEPKYSKIQYIGHGGMGVVYKAFDRTLDRWVALKIALPGRFLGPEDTERFRREAQHQAKLKHDHIVPVYEVGTHSDGRTYFTMELMEGGTLSDRLTHYAKDRRAAVRLLVDVARAVHHGHQRRCLHRDLKPGNILLDDNLRPHVTDFGLAAPLGTDMRLPATGAVEGTVGYMSPEQAVGNQDLTTASDIFALGAILHSLLTGEPPHVTGKSEGSQSLTKEWKPGPLAEASSHTDRGLRAICLKCLKPDPDERYGSADALADDLKRWLDGKRPGPDPWPAWLHVWRWCKRNPLGTSLTATAAALVFVVTMAVIWIEDDKARRIAAEEATRRAALETEQARYDIFEGHVKTKSLEIANRFSHYQMLLEHLRGSAIEVLTRVEPSPDQPVYPADYFVLGHERRPPDLLRSDVHGSLVSLEHPSVVEAPKTDVQEKTRQQLTLLGPAFQRVMVRSRDSKIELPPPAHDDLIPLLVKTGVPIAWAYVGLKSGIDCTYPGVGGFRRDYDPRLRPWYIEAAQLPNRGVVWSIYLDELGMGRVLTCSAPIYDHDDRFLGVVGVDLLERFVKSEMLKIADPLLVDAFLVNGQGEVLVSNVKGNLPAGAVKEIQARKKGRIRIKDKLVAYFPVKVSGWYYVVVADVDHIQKVLDTMPRQQHDRLGSSAEK